MLLSPFLNFYYIAYNYRTIHPNWIGFVVSMYYIYTVIGKKYQGKKIINWKDQGERIQLSHILKKALDKDNEVRLFNLYFL